MVSSAVRAANSQLGFRSTLGNSAGLATAGREPPDPLLDEESDWSGGEQLTQSAILRNLSASKVELKLSEMCLFVEN
jgi:hypothetical protein